LPLPAQAPPKPLSGQGCRDQGDGAKIGDPDILKPIFYSAIY
jgi:hypothetical protein